MRSSFATSALVAVALVVAVPAVASARGGGGGSLARGGIGNTGGGVIGPSGIIGSPASPSVSAPITGGTTGSASSQMMPPAMPSRPVPSGLPGDNPAAPGFPGRVGG